MSLDLISLIIGALVALIPGILAWYLNSRKEKEELREFISFVKEETTIRQAGGAGYWWNPLPEEHKKYAILSRLVQKGLLVYRPGEGFTLPSH